MLKKRKIVIRISLSTNGGKFDSGKGRDVILEGYRTMAEITDIHGTRRPPLHAHLWRTT